MFKIKVLFIYIIYIAIFPISIFANSIHILMPVYNTAEYLTKSISSVFNQSFDDLILIVYNDGSTDRSNTVLKEYYNKQLKKMVLFGSDKNKGVSFARKVLLNKSFELDPDAYILWLDSDDRYIDNTFIDKFHAQMEKTKADICLFNVKIILEADTQQNNSINVMQELKKHEEVLDYIYNSKTQCLSPDLMGNILNVTCLGHTKGYKKKKNGLSL
jgi:glycosyltransferase involved in cell wall biosynthesis